MIRKEIDELEMREIASIDKEAFPTAWTYEMYEKMRRNSNYKFYVHSQKGEVTGYALILNQYDSYELMKIAVKKEYRKQGIARALINSIISDIDKELFLEVRINNKKAVNLYRGLKFKEIGLRKNYYKDTNEDALIFKFEKGE
jgi:ribosomal-protein-alanine N-acetyltransferase